MLPISPLATNGRTRFFSLKSEIYRVHSEQYDLSTRLCVIYSVTTESFLHFHCLLLRAQSPAEGVLAVFQGTRRAKPAAGPGCRGAPWWVANHIVAFHTFAHERHPRL